MPKTRSRGNWTEYPEPLPEKTALCPNGPSDMCYPHADHDRT